LDSALTEESEVHDTFNLDPYPDPCFILVDNYKKAKFENISIPGAGTKMRDNFSWTSMNLIQDPYEASSA
jgi:hypothetical protein